MSQTSGPSAAKAAAAASVETGKGAASANAGVASPRVTDPSIGANSGVDDETIETLLTRVTRLERRARMQFFALALLILVGVGFAFDSLLIEHVIVRQTLMESKEVKLLDSAGNARLFIRMYSRVPVLQIIDGNGKPRMSMGLRFDDSPFLDLSDRSGRTRATFEITEDNAPALRMFDENGNPTFNIN